MSDSAPAERLLEALARRRATGARLTAAAAPAAALTQVRDWGATRALAPDEPLLDELGVIDALRAADIEVLRWPAGRAGGWRELLGLEGPTDTVALTTPDLAVAERGTLVLAAEARRGRSLDAVCERHLAVLPASRIRLTLADALREQFAPGRPVASAVSLVSAPSRTSDIEKISTLGAHGALSLHVLVVEDR